MRLGALLLASLLGVWLFGAAHAQPPNAVLLVAQPGLQDPNFRETVVLVTQTPDAQTVGVILNRPLPQSLEALAPEGLPTGNYRDRVFFGGPVLRRSIVAVFRSPRAPTAAAFPLLQGLYLSMHPANVRALLAEPERKYRLYAGFSGWAPRQLEAELARDGWYVMPASEELIFRADTGSLWKELVERRAMSKTKAIY